MILLNTKLNKLKYYFIIYYTYLCYNNKIINSIFIISFRIEW
jgi:hypothetical protein